jgi:hypothetical protein
MSSETEALPCPNKRCKTQMFGPMLAKFTETKSGSIAIFCQHCGLRGPFARSFPKAEANWNRLAGQAPPQLLDPIDALFLDQLADVLKADGQAGAGRRLQRIIDERRTPEVS